MMGHPDGQKSQQYFFSNPLPRQRWMKDPDDLQKWGTKLCSVHGLPDNTSEESRFENARLFVL